MNKLDVHQVDMVHPRLCAFHRLLQYYSQCLGGKRSCIILLQGNGNACPEDYDGGFIIEII